MLERNVNWNGLGWWGVVGLIAIAVAIGCSKTRERPSLGTNTNWLQPCSANAECDGEASCLCGVCTKPCSGAAQCGDLGAAAECTALAAACGRGASGSACLPSCDSSADCSMLEDSWCSAGVCVPDRPPVAPPSAGSMSPPPDAGMNVPPTVPDSGSPQPTFPYQLSREDSTVVVTSAYTECARDTDCMLVGTGCDGCCQRAAIRSDLEATYQMNFDNACRDFVGGVCSCAPEPLAARCEEGACKAVLLDPASDCYSPTENLALAYDQNAGCVCDLPDAAVCVDSTALSCRRNNDGELVWTAVMDGACAPTDPSCSLGNRLDTVTECIEGYENCFELPDGKFCGQGCNQPLACRAVDCAPYAPLENVDCTGLVGIWEGTCGTVRYRHESTGVTTAARYWDAESGELLAVAANSDEPAFCDGASFSSVYGDPRVVRKCEIIQDATTALCPQ